MAVAERTAAPLRVAVRGRPGVGCSTVARALDLAGSRSGITVTTRGIVSLTCRSTWSRRSSSPRIPPRCAADGSPVLAVLNKADLTGFGGDGPIAAARCPL